MRVAVAGLGGASTRGHLPALTQLGEAVAVVGCAEPDAVRRSEITARLPHLPLFADTGEMLDAVACDILVVATEPGAHAGLVELGIRRGVHVLCEKPVSVTGLQHEAVARACARRPDLALVPMHQYRYSPQWITMSRWARRASRLRRPYSLTIDVQRAGTDPHAVSSWRADTAVTGGMLADAGVHFLALAWTIDERLDLLAAARQQDAAGNERSAAIVAVGSGVFTIHAWNGAPARHTRVELRLDRAAITWQDNVAALTIADRTMLRRSVDALSDRSHVDALYLSLYRELLTGIRSETWRKRRTAEALAVTATLIEVLERSPIDRVASS